MIIKKGTYFESCVPGVTGIGFANDAEFGVSGSHQITTVEAPVRFESLKYDLGFVGAFTFTNYNDFIRAKSIGRFCSIAQIGRASCRERV